MMLDGGRSRRVRRAAAMLAAALARCARRGRRHPRAARSFSCAASYLATLCILPLEAPAQQASIQGIVTSARSGSPLEGVTIVLEDDEQPLRSTLTDRNGFYQIGAIDPGTYTLRSHFFGHREFERSITLTAEGWPTVNVALEADVVALEGLVVSAARGAAVTDLGRQRITPADLRLVPVPGGSGDLAGYLQTLPGVVAPGDRGGHLFVRGGTASENLALVDGIPIYQPFHILGFASAFPENLVSGVDFYAGGFGARYSGRTSSVLDVTLRDGDRNKHGVSGSVSPFLVEAVIEGPVGDQVSWMVSLRRSLIEETSEALLGTRQPLGFDSQLFKVTAAGDGDLRCSLLALRTADRGGLDPEEPESYVGWRNMLAGGRCVTQFNRFLRLLEVNFSTTTVENTAVSEGSSRFRSRLWRMQNDAHVTSMVGSIPLYAGYHAFTEITNYNLAELFDLQAKKDLLLGFGGYLEAAIPIGARVAVRPGVVVTAAPRVGVEPRLRASWEPFGRSSERLQGAVGLYRQYVVGASDMRDVGSAFAAWMPAPNGAPLESLHANLGWQQSTGDLRWSVEGYYRGMRDIPVAAWRAVAQFIAPLARAEGEVYGGDIRIEYVDCGFHGLIGYGYSWTQYEVSQAEYGSWLGDPVQQYHPAHDRRHQINTAARIDLGGFEASARWQFGSGLPFTRFLGFDEAFDYSGDLHDVRRLPGTTRLVLDRPFTGRLPVMHRLDVSLGRGFDLPFGRLVAQVGAMNAYDRRNMFYYDLFTGRRVDQLPVAPYASLMLRN